MELNDMEAKRQGLERHLAAGGKLPPIPDGPYMEIFDSLELAQALEQEIKRCMAQGWVKVSISMDPANAARLAAFLRRASLVTR